MEQMDIHKILSEDKPCHMGSLIGPTVMILGLLVALCNNMSGAFAVIAKFLLTLGRKLTVGFIRIALHLAKVASPRLPLKCTSQPQMVWLQLSVVL